MVQWHRKWVGREGSYPPSFYQTKSIEISYFNGKSKEVWSWRLHPNSPYTQTNKQKERVVYIDRGGSCKPTSPGFYSNYKFRFEMILLSAYHLHSKNKLYSSGFCKGSICEFRSEKEILQT